MFKLTLGDVLGLVRGTSADGCLLLHYGGILLLYLKKIIVIVGLLVIGIDFQAGQKGGEKGKEGEKKTARGDSCEAPVSASDVCNVVRCASDVERFHLYIHLHVCVVKVVVVYTAIYLTCVSFECLYVGGFSLNHPPSQPPPRVLLGSCQADSLLAGGVQSASERNKWREWIRTEKSDKMLKQIVGDGTGARANGVEWMLQLTILCRQRQ